MTYAVRGYLGAFDPVAYYGPSGTAPSSTDQMREIARNMANDLHSRATQLASALGAITRAESYSSQAFRQAIDIASRLAPDAAAFVRFTRQQFVAMVQVGVAQVAAMSVTVKRLAMVPNIAEVWPVLGSVATSAGRLEQTLRAMTSGAQEQAGGVSGLGLLFLLTHPAVLGAIVIAGSLVYAYHIGLRDAEQAGQLGIDAADAAWNAACRGREGTTGCTMADYAATVRSVYREAAGPSVADLMERLAQNARAAQGDWLQLFKEPILYVSVIGGIALLAAGAYAAWPYLTTVRRVGSRQARRLKRAKENEE